MHAAFEKAGWQTLSGAHELLRGRFDYGKLRLYRAAHGPRPVGTGWPR